MPGLNRRSENNTNHIGNEELSHSNVRDDRAQSDVRTGRPDLRRRYFRDSPPPLPLGASRENLVFRNNSSPDIGGGRSVRGINRLRRRRVEINPYPIPRRSVRLNGNVNGEGGGRGEHSIQSQWPSSLDSTNSDRVSTATRAIQNGLLNEIVEETGSEHRRGRTNNLQRSLPDTILYFDNVDGYISTVSRSLDELRRLVSTLPTVQNENQSDDDPVEH